MIDALGKKHYKDYHVNCYDKQIQKELLISTLLLLYNIFHAVFCSTIMGYTNE